MNQYGQRGRQDQRQDNQWGQGDRDRSHYGAQTGSQRGHDRSREDQQAAYQGSSIQADRDDSRGGTYGGGYGGSYGQGRDERDDYRQDYRSHGDYQSQGGYRGGYENEGWGGDRGRSMSGNYGGGSQGDSGGYGGYSGSGDYGSRSYGASSGYGRDSTGSGAYRDQGPRHEGWREDAGRRGDYGGMAGSSSSSSYGASLGEHYGGSQDAHLRTDVADAPRLDAVEDPARPLPADRRARLAGGVARLGREFVLHWRGLRHQWRTFDLLTVSVSSCQ